MPEKRSLIDYLTHKNPEPELRERRSADGTKVKSRTYTTHDQYPTPSRIRKWHEFDFGTVLSLFNNEIDHTLNKEYADLHDVSYVPKAALEISNEHSLESLLCKTTHSVVLEALEKTSVDILSQRVLMVPGGRGGSRVLNSRKLGPDWAGKSEDQEDNNILPGDTKLSRNWQSKEIKNIIKHDGKLKELNDVKGGVALVAPLEQLLHYCIESYMRYGYIITDKELVVFRVGPEDPHRVLLHPSFENMKQEMTDSAIMAWQSIPSKNHGKDNQMTITIALWVLHLLAANNGALEAKYGRLVEEIRMDPKSQMRQKLEPQKEAAFVQSSFRSAATDATRSSNGDHDFDPLVSSFRSNAS